MTPLNSIEHRVTVLELRMDATESDVQDVKDEQKNTARVVSAIETNLLQIKYAVYGGALVMAAQTFGIGEIVKKLAGL
jgi:hypothetical protein